MSSGGGAAGFRRLCRSGGVLGRAFRGDESGQILPVMAFMMVALLGLTGLVLDVGHVYMCHRELQASCDAAALAGATAMAGATSNPLATTASGVKAIATNYSAVSGTNNAYKNLPNVTMVSGFPALACLTTFQSQGVSCVGYVPYNAVKVKLQAVIPLQFASLFGIPTMTIQASSTAVKGGGPSRPYNIVVMLDATPSMNYYDADCGATQMQCSLAGLQVLLQHLDPCGTSQPTCTVTAGNAKDSVARVSLFTFPQMTYPTASADYGCAGTPTATAYTFPSAIATSYNPGTSNNSTTYRVIDFQSDYRVSDTAIALYATSRLATAFGAKSGCPGMASPYNAGNYDTYYAATLYASEAALIQEQTANPGSQNVLIILGDGDSNAPQIKQNPAVGPGPVTVMGAGATATGLYPSYYGECGQAITAAQYASKLGTIVYTVAYGSKSTGGCTTDTNAGSYPNVQPCNEMALMATHSWDFFSDYKQSGAQSSCVAAQTEVALSDIFLQIAGDLTEARLVTDTAT